MYCKQSSRSHVLPNGSLPFESSSGHLEADTEFRITETLIGCSHPYGRYCMCIVGRARAFKDLGPGAFVDSVTYTCCTSLGWPSPAVTGTPWRCCKFCSDRSARSHGVRSPWRFELRVVLLRHYGTPSTSSHAPFLKCWKDCVRRMCLTQGLGSNVLGRH